MTPQEFQYIKRAVEALEQGTTDVTQIKILKTISQVAKLSAQRLETRLVDRIEDRLYNTNT
jgi:hypothetical protein